MNDHNQLVPDGFAHVALALPNQVKNAIANIDNQTDATELVDQADTIAINAIQEAKLWAIAKLAEFLPRSKGGRPKKG